MRRSRIDPFRDQVGKVPDRVIAEKAGVTPSAVQYYRETRGITAYGRGGRPADSDGGSNEKVAKALRNATGLLGLVPDDAVAGMVGISVSSVRRSRRALGVGPAPAGSGPQRIRRSKIARHHDIVGTKTDADIAELAGVTAGAVQAYRAKFDIPAYGRSAPTEIDAALPPEPGESARPERAASPATPTAAASSTGYVWRVLGHAAGEDTFVVAGTLVEAAQRSVAAGFQGGIERVGRVVG